MPRPFVTLKHSPNTITPNNNNNDNTYNNDQECIEIATTRGLPMFLPMNTDFPNGLDWSFHGNQEYFQEEQTVKV